MRQAVLILVVIATFAFSTACGGSKPASTAPASIIISPAVLSLNQGEVQAVTATVLDSSGSTASNPKSVTFTTSNPAIATVTSSTGGVCGGVWDANNIVCAAGQVGTATITATSGTFTATTTVYVHKKVDRVVINTPTGVCKSVGQSLQLSATAFSNGVDVTSTVGPFTWGSSSPDIALVDNTGLLTAKAPGQGSIFASVANVSSVPTIYTTCAVRSIHVHTSGATSTTFPLASSGSTQQLVADVVDTAGNTITPTLNWVSTGPAVASVSSTGLVTATTPGTAGIIAECAITCNFGLPAVYSDVAVGTVAGSSATTVYVTGTSTTSLVPIDTGTNAAGTTITLPSQPNSIVFAPLASRAYLGSSSGLITLDATANTVTQNTAYPGKVLAVSPDGNRVIVADTSLVYGVNVGSTAGAVSDSLGIAGATAAAFVPDSSRAFIVAGNTMYAYTPNTGTAGIVTLLASAKDILVSPSAAFAVIANGAPNAITAAATCDASLLGNFATSGAPTQLGVVPDASKILAVDSPNIDVFTRSSLLQPGCPPPVTGTVSSVNLGQGAFTANELVVTNDGSKAYITSNLPSVLVYNVSAGTASAIPLAAGATGLSESATLDGAKLYVGGSDNTVHRIDTASASDAQQISITFTPNLVAVRPK